jgi:hypothetical protein
MYHVYLVTDGEGSWPLLCDGPLEEGPCRKGTAVVALLGRFLRADTARAALDLARAALLADLCRHPAAPSPRWVGDAASGPPLQSARARRASWNPKGSASGWPDGGPKT